MTNKGGWTTGYMITITGWDRYERSLHYTDPIVYLHRPNEADIEMFLDKVSDVEHVPCLNLNYPYTMDFPSIQVTWLKEDIGD